MDLGSFLAGLVLEQVHGVTGVVPEQVVGPASRLAFGVDVPAPEEIGLHVHLLDGELAGLDSLVNPLVAGIESPRVPRHRNETRLFLHPHQPFGVGQRVGHGDLDFHMLAGAHALFGLVRVHLGGCSQDRSLDARLGKALGQVRRPVRDAEFPGDRFGRVRRAAGQRGDFDAVDAGQSGQVLLAEGALAGHTDLHDRYSLSTGWLARTLRAATGK